MELHEFAAQVPGFFEMSHPDRIRILGWYLHVHGGCNRFDLQAIRGCYEGLNFAVPNLSRDFERLIDRSPPVLLKDAGGYRLEGRARAALDAEYGEAPTTIAVGNMLTDLPAKIPGINERVFLQEAITCLRGKAFRAAIVMSWNLAFDHLLRWLLNDSARLATFNTAITKKYPKKTGVHIVVYEDFEDLKESEVIEILNVSGLVGGGVIKVLQKELIRRNNSAHPSAIVFTQYQAQDTISDLVNNVLLKL